MPVWTLRAINLPERERMELGLMLPLLGQHSGGQWELAETGGAHAAIVDVDAEDAPEAITEAWGVARIVITLSAGDAGAEELHVRRPLRTQTLTRVLAGAAERAATERSETGSGGSERAGQQTAYRLRRWPSTDTLRREWRLTRICGALARGPQASVQIAYRTGMEARDVDALLAMLADAGCVEATEVGEERTESMASAPPRGLLRRLRARLGRN